MNEQLPLEQIVIHRREPLQYFFAARAIEVVPASDDYVLEPVREGLRVRAANEAALDLPAEILRDAFGDELAFLPVAVTLQHHDGSTYEPVMFVRAEVPADIQAAVRAALCARAATILEEDAHRASVVIRALAPQQSLLGFPAELHETAGSEARLWIWLSHYAPVEAKNQD
ncbi:MAG: hypothetical protein ABI648_17505 [Betaproteobacteria bacterium]|jgi:predicted membrane GTPase involved in stress response